MTFRSLVALPLVAALLAFAAAFQAGGAEPASKARETIARAAAASDPKERADLIASLAGEGDPVIRDLLGAWRGDALYLAAGPDGAPVAVLLAGEPDAGGKRELLRLDTGAPLLAADGSPARAAPGDLKTAEHDNRLRKAMKGVIDLLDLASPDAATREKAVRTLGFSQATDKMAALEKRLGAEPDAGVRGAIREALALIGLKAPDEGRRMAALRELKTLHTLASSDFVKAAEKTAREAGRDEEAALARSALVAIEFHRGLVDFAGTIFRGLSLGSVLLVVSIGLAVTFGLMGVINMAHGEMIAVGAYTAYVVQNVFGPGLAMSPFGLSLRLPGMGAGGWLMESYFLFALPCSFAAAALAGIALERGVIRFLYRRPLESLLATWGVSLVLQQLFRLVFGANNVQVSSPSYLSGNWTVNDVILGWNRVFVIGFALLIVAGTYLVLTRTSLGLLIRAVMQNRGMASCMGVRTERVNMLAFGLGSGLAGLGGAFLSQIGNVGPSLGQSYIIDCFMTVVVGGVGSLFGTVVSAFGIGLLDQSLQQILLNPVLGKILVLSGIILFLQWRPAGIFAVRGRGLED